MNTSSIQSGIYRCKKCDWKGKQNQLELDVVETCFGNDDIEMCPKCGSYDVKKIKSCDAENDS